MSMESGIFDSINGDRRFLARFFAKMLGTFFDNGVFPNPSTNLQVVENDNLIVTVKPGTVWINGYFANANTDHHFDLDIADGVLKRIDRIVARLDLNERKIKLEVKKGAFASNPVAPPLQRDADAWELALADVLINNGATTITQANITDQRLNGDLCGIVSQSVKSVDTTTLFNQYQTWLSEQKEFYEENIENWTADQQADFLAWRELETTDFDEWQANEKQEFEDWVTTLEGILSGDVAGNLWTMINDNANNLVEHSEVMATKEVAGHVILGEGLEVGDDGKVKTNTAELRTELSDRIDRNSYDDYQLWLELYYKGVIGQVEAASAKAIMFDGFMDDKNILSGGTLDVDSSQLCSEKSATKYDNFSRKNTNYGGRSYFHSNNVNSVSTASYDNYVVQPSATLNLNFGTVFELPGVSVIDEIEFRYAWEGQFSVELRLSGISGLEFSIDGITWKSYLGGFGGPRYEGGSGFGLNNYRHIVHSLNKPIVAKFIRFMENHIVKNDNSLYSRQFRMATYMFHSRKFLDSSVLSKIKGLPFNFSKAHLYLSTVEDNGTAISPFLLNGADFKMGELISSREDDKFSGFTEKIYSFDVNETNKLQLKLNLTSVNNNYTPVVKRYGLLLT